MKARFLWATVIALILLSLPALVLAQPPITPSTGPSGDGVEGAPLGSPDVLWDQPSEGSGGLTSQYFPFYCFVDVPLCGMYSADDFMNTLPWNIESIFVDGEPSLTDPLLHAFSLNWYIYPDAGGNPPLTSYPGTGGEVWSYSCKPSDPEVSISGPNNCQVTLDIVMAQGSALYLPPGTYWLCFYPDLDFYSYGQWYWDRAGTTNGYVAHVIDPNGLLGLGFPWTPWSDHGPYYDLAFRLEGSSGAPPTPSNLKYLHCTGGLFNLTDPIGTQWHELWPIFCREYHLSSWNDTSGDGVLSYCDRIDMYEKPDGELRPYHVENVTITLFLTPMGTGDPMYIELEGGFNETVLMNPIGTLWHEIYPNFCTTYNLTLWEDNGNVTLDFCDFIDLIDTETENVTSWHVEEVAIDIIVTPEPPPVGGEAYPVSKASLLAPWIAVGLVLAGGATWYFLRRRRAQS